MHTPTLPVPHLSTDLSTVPAARPCPAARLPHTGQVVRPGQPAPAPGFLRGLLDTFGTWLSAADQSTLDGSVITPAGGPAGTSQERSSQYYVQWTSKARSSQRCSHTPPVSASTGAISGPGPVNLKKQNGRHCRPRGSKSHQWIGNFTHTRLGPYHTISGPGPSARHALAARTTHAIRQAKPRPLARTLPARTRCTRPVQPGTPASCTPLASMVTSPFLYPTSPHPLPTARPAWHARLHDAQPRFHSTHRIRRRNTAPPQVAPNASTLHCAQGPKSPRPGTGPHR